MEWIDAKTNKPKATHFESGIKASDVVLVSDGITFSMAYFNYHTEGWESIFKVSLENITHFAYVELPKSTQDLIIDRLDQLELKLNKLLNKYEQ